MLLVNNSPPPYLPFPTFIPSCSSPTLTLGRYPASAIAVCGWGNPPNTLPPPTSPKSNLHNWKYFVNHTCLGCADLFWTFNSSYYNSTMKVFFIASTAYTLYLMKNEYRPTHDPQIDTFMTRYLLAGAALLAIIFPYKYTISELLWTFSIWLESVAILPQLFIVQRTGEAETITTHYIFALGIYRALYIPNWLWRYFVDSYKDPIALLAGVVQTVLYCDFFYIYWTK